MLACHAVASASYCAETSASVGSMSSSREMVASARSDSRKWPLVRLPSMCSTIMRVASSVQASSTGSVSERVRASSSSSSWGGAGESGDFYGLKAMRMAWTVCRVRLGGARLRFAGWRDVRGARPCSSRWSRFRGRWPSAAAIANGALGCGSRLPTDLRGSSARGRTRPRLRSRARGRRHRGGGGLGRFGGGGGRRRGLGGGARRRGGRFGGAAKGLRDL